MNEDKPNSKEHIKRVLIFIMWCLINPLMLMSIWNSLDFGIKFSYLEWSALYAMSRILFGGK